MMNAKMKFVCVAVGAVLLACSVWLGLGRTKVCRMPPRDGSAAFERAREKYEQRVNAELEDFPNRVRECAREAFSSVRAQIPSVVSGYGFSKCVSLTKALAIDKYKGGDSHKFKDALDADLSEGFYTPLLAARQRVLNEWSDLQRRVGEERKIYLDACAAEAKQIDDPTLMAKLEEDSRLIEEKLLDLYAAKLSAGVSAVAEAAMLAGTLSAIRTVLAPVAAKACASLASGAVVSQFDTPAPGPFDIIGAAIAAGGLAWSAYDIRKAAKVLPRELESALKEVVDDQEEGLVDMMLSAAKSVRGT